MVNGEEMRPSVTFLKDGPSPSNDTNYTNEHEFKGIGEMGCWGIRGNGI